MGYYSNFLEIETNADSHKRDSPYCAEEAVVVAAATAQTMTLCIEGDTWDDSNIYLGIVGERLADGFHNVERPLAEVSATSITAQFHRGLIKHFRQENGLAFSHQIVEKLMGADLVRQGIISEDGLHTGQPLTQTVNDGLRKLF